MSDRRIEPSREEEADLRARIENLFARNPFSAALGIELRACGIGTAELALVLTPACLNAHGTGHGGAILTLADMAFGAAGFYDGQILTTASSLNFVRPALAGARLVAHAREITRTRRSGHFDITIVDASGSDANTIAFGQFSGQWLKFIHNPDGVNKSP